VGNLALWGAVGGLGKGIEKNADAERSQQAAAAQHEREMAIRKFEAEEAAKRQGTGITAQKEMQTQELGAREKLQSTEIKAKQQSQSEEEKFKAGEGAKNRASAERIAGIRAEATKAGKGGTAKGRWKLNTVKTDPYIDPNTNKIMPGGVQYVLGDTNRGIQFVQDQDRFLLPGADPKTTKRAAASEVQKLMDNPDQADNFMAAYKYLPAQFIAAQTSRANYSAAGTADSAATAEPDDTDEQ